MDRKACSGTWSYSPFATLSKASMVSASLTNEPTSPVNFSAKSHDGPP